MVFNQVATSLQYTPRKLAVHPPSSNLLIIETDHNTENVFGAVWSSCLKIMHTTEGKTLELVQFQQNASGVPCVL